MLQYYKLYKRIIQWLGLEVTLRIIQLQPPAVSREIFHLTGLLRASSNLTLNTTMYWASTASLSNLFNCLSALMVKNFFLISSLILPSFDLKPSWLVLMPL